MPTTLLCGRPEALRRTQTIASSGLVTQMTNAFGQFFLIPLPTDSMTDVLMPRRSSRLMPGLRATPAVTMTTSEPLRAVYLLAPLMAQSKPSTGEDSAKSSALPCGMPSTMSKRTTSPNSLSPARCASVPPILPAPMRAILLRAMYPFLY